MEQSKSKADKLKSKNVDKKKKKRDKKKNKDKMDVDSELKSGNSAEGTKISNSSEESISTSTEDISAGENKETSNLPKFVSQSVEEIGGDHKLTEKGASDVPDLATIASGIPKSPQAPSNYPEVHDTEKIQELSQSSPEPEIISNAPVSGESADRSRRLQFNDYVDKLTKLAKSGRTHSRNYITDEMMKFYSTLQDNETIFNTGLKYARLSNDVIHALFCSDKWTKEPIGDFPSIKGSAGIYSEREPLGMVMLVGHDFYEVVDALVACISSGNCCVVKLSNDNPRIGELFNEKLESVRFVYGGEEFLLPEVSFDKIVRFNSSHEDQREVDFGFYTYAYETRGKCPAIILKDVDSDGMKVACRRITWGFTEYGEGVIDYILVPESLHELFIKEMELVEQIPPGERVRTWKFKTVEPDKKLPVIRDGATWDNFSEPGDTIPVITYTDINETCDLINKTHSTHTMYIFTGGSIEKTKNFQVKKIANKVNSRGVIINDILPIGLLDAPTGSIYGWVRKFTHERTIVEQKLSSGDIYGMIRQHSHQVLDFQQCLWKRWFHQGNIKGDLDDTSFWTGIWAVIQIGWEYLRG
ncbi:hypothetical protein JA1_004881 [Spathaspora sp. JA1]|nr:hypothetical protein JA1_004881 [Spathaspora sp. JA1]